MKKGVTSIGLLVMLCGLLVGCNTKLDKLTLEVRSVELVGYR